MTELLPTQLAWAAGFIEGEGCIRLYVHTRGGAWKLRVTVGSTNVLQVKQLHEYFGGSFYPRKSTFGKHTKPQWCWEVSTRSAEEVLRAIEPYIVGKKEEVRLGLLSRQYIAKYGPRKPDRIKLAEIDAALRLEKKRVFTTG